MTTAVTPMQSDSSPWTVRQRRTLNWEQMRGNDKRRFCEHCQRFIHNVSVILPVLVAVIGLAGGCASTPTRNSTDIRASLLGSAKASDPDFPDGRNTVLT